MRTIFLNLILVLSISAVHAQVRLDAGIAFGTEVANPGFSFGAEIFVTDEISINPAAIIYFEDRGKFDDRDWWEMNINGHYYFAQEAELEFFGLAGLNITTRAIELGEFRDPDTEVGFNLGIGANYQWKDMFLPFATFKYIAGNADQAVFNVGMRFLILE
jgi:hypothetical protein